MDIWDSNLLADLRTPKRYLNDQYLAAIAGKGHGDIFNYRSIVGRLVQGAGGAGLISLPNAIVGDRSGVSPTISPSRTRVLSRRTHSTRTIDDTEIGVVDLAPAIIDGKSRPTADGTIIRELAGVLRPAVEHAIHERRLVAGSYYIPVPAQPAGRDYWITRSEAARLLWETRRDKRARLHLPLFTLIALYTGQRRSAILDLTWLQINWDRRWINFNPPGRIQTAKRRPIISVPRSLFAALRRAHARAISPFVIAYAHGDGERVGSVKNGFNSAAERAGIPNCTSHTLRHTAGTWMAQRGVPLYEIAGYLGHSEKRTTELYAHHHPDHMARARAAMESH